MFICSYVHMSICSYAHMSSNMLLKVKDRKKISRSSHRVRRGQVGSVRVKTDPVGCRRLLRVRLNQVGSTGS